MLVLSPYRSLDRPREKVQKNKIIGMTGKVIDPADEDKGSQGMLLAIDPGTYRYVTSSNTIVTGGVIGLRYIENIIGIVKAFTTKLTDKVGEYLYIKKK
ncbi:MAG: adenylosuccinate synthetase [Candidatus Dasytiphilus stammeri]